MTDTLPPATDQRGVSAETPVIALTGVDKTFGLTRANRGITLTVRPGEIIGLVGANGAGKSTLIQIISGLLAPDQGQVEVGGRAVDAASYDRRAAQEMGVRTVFQELSLCSNLSLVDNGYLENPALDGRGWNWRRAARDRALATIRGIFPMAEVDAHQPIESLPIATRQMIEIARAASDPRLRLLILDEPTSSLDARQSEALRAYVRRRVAEGVAVIFVSHKLTEIMDLTTRIAVLRNGALVWEGESRSIGLPDLVRLMGAEASEAERKRSTGGAEGKTLYTLPADAPLNGLGRPIELRAGEVVGLAGLEGSGQPALLHALFRNRANGSGFSGERGLKTTFVSGDRPREGVFHGMSVLLNATITRTAFAGMLAPLTPAADRRAGQGVLAGLGIPEERQDSPILSMSGGNQQKALMARPLLVPAEVTLLDEPTRGVDVQTKQQIYGLIHDVAEKGRLVVWYTTEDAEFRQCDRVLVLHAGQIVAELVGEAITEDSIVDASFARLTHTAQADKAASRHRADLWRHGFTALPFVALAVLYAVIVALDTSAASMFGLDLLLTAAVPLVFVALAQMFIVGGSQIDLSAGAFTALANVISATLMVNSTALGILALALALAAYVGIGVLVQARRMPSLIVTLGASFLWLGIGHVVQPTPGGASPDWLTAVFALTLPGIPNSITLIVLAGIVGWLLNRARFGIVLRGFGNNERAMVQSGWKPLRAQALRYAVAGLFLIAGGVIMTGLNSSSDANTGGAMTLLSVATVVIGGCTLMGGHIAPAGVVAGAVTLSLVGSLLGALGISTNYSAAIQGLLLIVLLMLQTIGRRVAR